MGGKPGKMLLWFLRLEHLAQAKAKAVFEGAPAETRRQGDSNNVGAWLGKWKGSI